jgi:hypothetical protein
MKGHVIRLWEYEKIVEKLEVIYMDFYKRFSIDVLKRFSKIES